MNSRSSSYQVFFIDQGHDHIELEGIENQFINMGVDVGITRVNKISAIFTPRLNQFTVVVIMTKQVNNDQQFYIDLESLLKTKAKVIMFPIAVILDPRVVTIRSRVELVNGIKQLLGIQNNSLKGVMSLSEMGQNRRNNVFMYLMSKNKNFNSQMGMLPVKYKGTPIQFIQARKLDEAKRIIGAQVILVICNWQANEFGNLINIVRNQTRNVKPVMYITSGAPFHQQIGNLYDYSTSDYRQIMYLIDASIGKVNGYTNNSQQISVHQSRKMITNTINNSITQQIMYQPQYQVMTEQNISPLLHQIIQNNSQPVIHFDRQHEMKKERLNQGIAIGAINNLNNQGVNSSLINQTQIISIKNPIYSDQHVSQQIFNQNYGTRPQSTYLLNYPQNAVSNTQAFTQVVPNPKQFVSKNIQMISAKKFSHQSNVPSSFIVLENHQNEAFTTFYRSVIPQAELVQTLPASLIFTTPTVVLAPYEFRKNIYMITQDVQNLSFVLYAPKLQPDGIVQHKLIQLLTSNPQQLEQYLIMKKIISPPVYVPRSTTSINNEIIVPGIYAAPGIFVSAPAVPVSNIVSSGISNERMNKANSRIDGSPMEWVANSASNGQFIMNRYGSNQQINANNVHINQTIIPIIPHGSTINSSQAYKISESRVNPLDDLSTLMIGGKIPALSNNNSPIKAQSKQILIIDKDAHNLNQSSQLQQIIINRNEQSKIPIFAPSGVQRQSIKPPLLQQLPFIVDQSNIHAMNFPMQQMAIVPQSKLSNIQSEISKRQNGAFSSNLQDTINFNNSGQFSSLAFSHPTQIPYPSAQLQGINQPLVGSQLITQNIQYFPQQSIETTMQWKAFKDNRINDFVIIPLSHTSMTSLPIGQPITIAQNVPLSQSISIVQPIQQSIIQTQQMIPPPFLIPIPTHNSLPTTNVVSQLIYSQPKSNLMRSPLGVVIQPSVYSNKQQNQLFPMPTEQINYQTVSNQQIKQNSFQSQANIKQMVSRNTADIQATILDQYFVNTNNLQTSMKNIDGIQRADPAVETLNYQNNSNIQGQKLQIRQSLQSNIINTQIENKVHTVDQGTSPSEQYFPQNKRSTSPLRSMKIQAMNIQIDNTDRMPTVVRQRFSLNADQRIDEIKQTNKNQRVSFNTHILPSNDYGIVSSHKVNQNSINNSQSYERVSTDRIIQSANQLMENKMMNNPNFLMRVENGIKIYSRKSQQINGQNIRSKSISFTPNNRPSIQTANIYLHQQMTQPEHMKTVQHIIANNQEKALDHSISFNNLNQSRQNKPLNIRINRYPTQIKGERSGSLDFGRINDSKILSNAIQSNNFKTYDLQKTIRRSRAYEDIHHKDSFTSKITSNLTIVYPSDQPQIQTSLLKRLKNISHLKYNKKDSLFKYSSQTSFQNTIIILSIPFDRNVQQIKNLNHNAKILVFKGNPNLVNQDTRTLVVNSIPEILSYCQKMNVRK